MKTIKNGSTALILLASLNAPMAAGLHAQEREDLVATVYGTALGEGPEIDGIISARDTDRVQITAEDGTKTVIYVDEATEIRSKKGLFGMNKTDRGEDALLNGLPVKVETLKYDGGLVAKQITFKGGDFKTAAMIHNGTDQRFTKNEAATEALRSRMADIDKYNIKGTTNVYFDTGKWNLTQSGQYELCQAAAEAEAMDNALLLVVGYTDSVGDEDYNQTLSERRAGKVVNYLQQKCGWKPWRMVTPTGMAESDPLADNSTEEGRAQNRRVAVNILVSKSVDGFN